MKFTEDVLQRNDLVYKVLPPRWVFGLPIGNGQIGGMIWGGGRNESCCHT